MPQSSVFLEVTLGNGYETSVEVEFYYESEEAPTWDDPGFPGCFYVESITSNGDEELGLKAGQEIDIAYLDISMRTLEARIQNDQAEEAEYGPDWDEPDDFYDADIDAQVCWGD